MCVARLFYLSMEGINMSENESQGGIKKRGRPRKPVNQKELAARVRNSKNSKGPRDTTRTRRNASKNGFWSQALIPGEDPKLFQRLNKLLSEQPLQVLLEDVTYRLSMNIQRRNRITTHESAAIQHRRDNAMESWLNDRYVSQERDAIIDMLGVLNAETAEQYANSLERIGNQLGKSIPVSLETPELWGAAIRCGSRPVKWCKSASSC